VSTLEYPRVSTLEYPLLAWWPRVGCGRGVRLLPCARAGPGLYGGGCGTASQVKEIGFLKQGAFFGEQALLYAPVPPSLPPVPSHPIPSDPLPCRHDTRSQAHARTTCRRSFSQGTEGTVRTLRASAPYGTQSVLDAANGQH
jgi:hypothetical protein